MLLTALIQVENAQVAALRAIALCSNRFALVFNCHTP